MTPMPAQPWAFFERLRDRTGPLGQVDRPAIAPPSLPVVLTGDTHDGGVLLPANGFNGATNPHVLPVALDLSQLPKIDRSQRPLVQRGPTQVKNTAVAVQTNATQLCNANPARRALWFFATATTVTISPLSSVAAAGPGWFLTGGTIMAIPFTDDILGQLVQFAWFGAVGIGPQNIQVFEEIYLT